jgi:hypothetical protein
MLFDSKQTKIWSAAYSQQCRLCELKTSPLHVTHQVAASIVFSLSRP